MGCLYPGGHRCLVVGYKYLVAGCRCPEEVLCPGER